MDYEQLIDSLTPDIVERLRRSVETGRWPDGRALTPEQRENSLQAIIAWDQRQLPEDERVGYIDTSAKARGARSPDEVQPLRFKATPQEDS